MSEHAMAMGILFAVLTVTLSLSVASMAGAFG